MTRIRAAVIGATGYTGAELARTLHQHPHVDLIHLTSRSQVHQPYADTYGQFRDLIDLVCEEEDVTQLADTADVLFMALPHGHAAQKTTAALLEKTRVIDLGADFRLQNKDDYDTWYAMTHPQPALLPQAVYGLAEWHRGAIRQARLIANPGCYPTCSLLAALPLLKEKIITPEIIIDAKSGVTGAGRALNLAVHFTECNESLKAYALGNHRHIPEIEQGLRMFGKATASITFTPHLIPMNRGILATLYAPLAGDFNTQDIQAVFERYYKTEPFIRLLPPGVSPETRWVKGSNFCDIGFHLDSRNRRVILVSAIDNLGKGAAGQAIQNMNLLFGLPETTGLMSVPLFP